LAFVAADAAAIRPLIGTSTSIFLPAGPGYFIAKVIGGITQGGKQRIYGRCRTFVPASFLNEDQHPVPRAVNVQNTVALAIWHWDKIGEVTQRTRERSKR
jgi:hypothetical protein